MAQSLGFVLVHVIFSTKDRVANLNASVRPDLYAYLATIVRGAGCDCYRVGGVDDHVHLAIRLSRTIAVAKLIAELKASSSKWLKAQSPGLSRFAWQRGYGVFSVSPADLGALVGYIDAQDTHHAKHSFQDEFRAFLKRYGIEWNETYLWDWMHQPDHRSGFQPSEFRRVCTWGFAPGWYRARLRRCKPKHQPLS